MIYDLPVNYSTNTLHDNISSASKDFQNITWFNVIELQPKLRLIIMV